MENELKYKMEEDQSYQPCKAGGTENRKACTKRLHSV